MNFVFDNENLQQCQEVFNHIDPEERLVMTHYQLAKDTAITDPARWKEFLTNTKVRAWIEEEITLIKGTTLRRMISNADSNDRSVGAAQMLNALNKSFESDTAKEGAVFVYMHVPPNDRELGAPNVHVLEHNIFRKED